MSQFESEIKRRRTFAIISHPDAGKTTLTEKFLLYGGAIVQGGRALNPPGALFQGLDFGQFPLLLNLSHQLFQQVSDGDHSQQTAVFVQNHGVIGPALLHLLEENVCLEGLWDKERGLYHGVQDFLDGTVLEAEKVPGVQDTHHLVHRAGTDGIAGVPGFKEDLLPFLGGLACPEQVQFRAVGGEFSHGEVVKFKDILNELLGGGVKDPLLTAPVVTVLTASTNGVLRLLGVDPNADEEEVSEEEIKMMVTTPSRPPYSSRTTA